MILSLFSEPALSITLVATLYISSGYGLSSMERTEVEKIVNLASRHTSDFILDDLRACNFCFPYDDRYKCALLVRAVHHSKVGIKYDANLVANEVVPLFLKNEHNYEKFNCMSIRTENPSNTPNPTPKESLWERSPRGNARQLARSLKSEILELVPTEVNITFKARLISFDTNHQIQIADGLKLRDLKAEKFSIHLRKGGVKKMDRFNHVEHYGVVRQCGLSNCAARVKIWSTRNIRKVILQRALEKLKKTTGFRNVFNPKSQISKIGCCTFVVTIKFLDSYLNGGGY